MRPVAPALQPAVDAYEATGPYGRPIDYSVPADGDLLAALEAEGEAMGECPEPLPIVHTELEDEPIPFGMPEVVPAPEAESMARYIGVAKQAAREWKELDRLLVTMTVAERRDVLGYVQLVIEERGT